jgi:hypothetical protein
VLPADQGIDTSLNATCRQLLVISPHSSSRFTRINPLARLLVIFCHYSMSFDRLNSLEAQPTTMRRSDDPQYHDDPEFQRLTESLSNQLFTLTSNITRLSDQIALLGTKRDTERVRERVHSLLEQTRTGFRDVGDGIKKVQTWEDVNVCGPQQLL